jgi:hypothetical protein
MAERLHLVVAGQRHSGLKFAEKLRKKHLSGYDGAASRHAYTSPHPTRTLLNIRGLSIDSPVLTSIEDVSHSLIREAIV